MDEQDIMARIISLASRNVTEGGLPYAAIIVKNKEVIAEAVNGTHKSHDPSDHAELSAIRVASRQLQSPDLSGCILYVVGQPCAMCLACLVMAGLSTIVMAVDTVEKDRALSALPPTKKLYGDISDNFAGAIINYRILSDFAEQGQKTFKKWNDLYLSRHEGQHP